MLRARSAGSGRNAGPHTGAGHQGLAGPYRPAINRLTGHGRARGLGSTRTRSAGHRRHWGPRRTQLGNQIRPRGHHRANCRLASQGTGAWRSRWRRSRRCRRGRAKRLTGTRTWRLWHCGTLRRRGRGSSRSCHLGRRRRKWLARAGKNLSWLRSRGYRSGQRFRGRRRGPSRSEYHGRWSLSRRSQRRMNRPSRRQGRPHRRCRTSLFWRWRFPFDCGRSRRRLRSRFYGRRRGCGRRCRLCRCGLLGGFLGFRRRRGYSIERPQPDGDVFVDGAGVRLLLRDA